VLSQRADRCRRSRLTKDEVAAWFEENRARYDRQEAVTASHILVGHTQEEAEAQSWQNWKAELTFAALAQAAFSLDPGSASQQEAGTLGQITRGVRWWNHLRTWRFRPRSVGEMGIAGEPSTAGTSSLVTGRSASCSGSAGRDLQSEVERDYKALLGPHVPRNTCSSWKARRKSRSSGKGIK
jgi:hypothetical protein